MKVSAQLIAVAVSPPHKEFTEPMKYDSRWAPESVWKLRQRDKYLTLARIQTPIPWPPMP
jgi:hypothetical protein